MVSISTNSVLNIKQVMNIELKPTWMEKIVLSNLKEGLRYQKLVIQKDFLDLCARRKVCPQEILTLAKRVGRQVSRTDSDGPRDKDEELRILKIRIQNQIEEIKNTKTTWERSTQRVRTTINLSKEGNRRLNLIRQTELTRFWE